MTTCPETRAAADSWQEYHSDESVRLDNLVKGIYCLLVLKEISMQSKVLLIVSVDKWAGL